MMSKPECTAWVFLTGIARELEDVSRVMSK